MQKLARARGTISRSFIVDSHGAISIEPVVFENGSHKTSRRTPLERIDRTGRIEWCDTAEALRIQFRPSLTTSAARETVFRWLDCDLQRRVHLRYWWDGSWQDEIVGHSILAARRIEQILYHDAGGIDFPIVCRAKKANRPGTIQTHLDMLAFWSERRDSFSLETDFQILQSITAGRAILLRFDDSAGYVLDDAGLCLPPGLRKWMFNKTDQRLSDFPDALYAKHLGDIYHRATESSQPIADEVDGLIKFPSVPRQRYSYHRIVVPIQSNGARYIITSTIKDDSIDLFA